MLFNEYKNVKTIVFSELPQKEKVKYFNFLLENDINFSRDENGFYVALVKVLNPAFYGANQEPINKSGITPSKVSDDPESEAKPRSSSQTAQPKARTQNRTQQKETASNKRSKSPVGGKKGNFEKDKKASVPLANYSEMFNDCYKKFFSFLNPLVGVRGKKLNLYQLKYIIEEMYSIRFIKDTSTLRNQLNKKANQEIDVKDPFPTFVCEFLINKFVKKPMIDQHALDLLLSLEHYKKTCKEIEIFSKFLNEEYDTDDLIFFLFVRSCIEKETKVMFIEKAREEIKIQRQEDRDSINTELYLNIKVCLKIANTIFGNEEELLLNSFMEKVEKNILSGTEKCRNNLVKASTILEITLEDYHQSRKLYGQGGGGGDAADKLIQPGEVRKKKAKEEKMFDEFEEETNEYNNLSGKKPEKQTKKIEQHVEKISPQSKGNSDAFTSLQKNYMNDVPKNQTEKINRLKTIISAYIKEKELDVFFAKLMLSYTIYEKENSKKIEESMSSIKDLVTKKLALLINIIFTRDQHSWFASLKIKEDDTTALQHYNNMINLTVQMLNFTSFQEIPESLIENFAQTLLSTSELNHQINKLVLKRFE